MGQSESPPSPCTEAKNQIKTHLPSTTPDRFPSPSPSEPCSACDLSRLRSPIDSGTPHRPPWAQLAVFSRLTAELPACREELEGTRREEWCRLERTRRRQHAALHTSAPAATFLPPIPRTAMATVVKGREY
eukprot:767946-Hanusia_phi.AAC.4